MKPDGLSVNSKELSYSLIQKSIYYVTLLAPAGFDRFVLKSSPSSRILTNANDLMGELPEGCLVGVPA